MEPEKNGRSHKKFYLIGIAVLLLYLLVKVVFPFVPMMKDVLLSAGSVTEQKLQTVTPSSSAIWFDDVEPDSAYSPDEGEVIAMYLAAAIFDGKSIDEPIQYVRVDSSPRMIYLSLSDGTTTAVVLQAPGYGIKEALRNAAKQAKALVSTGLDVKWLTVDIVSDVYRIDLIEPTAPLKSGYEPDLYGLAFDRSTALSFLPGEIIGYGLIDSDDQLDFEDMQTYVETRQQSGELINKLELSSDLSVFRFSTLSYFADRDEVVRLYRNHRTFNQVTPEDLLAAAVDAGDYLARSVGAQGKFVYTYYPKSGTESNSYNILRHAGSTYAMLEVYEMTGHPDLLAAAERAIGYLLEHNQPCEYDRVQYSCIVENGEVKLGGNSLAILALAKYRQVSGNHAYDDVMKSLAGWIVAVQSETGEFNVHKMEYPSGTVLNFYSDYYPGEALLALMRLYEIDGDPLWLESADKGAVWLINVRDDGLAIADLQHDHWLLYALNELYRARPNELFIEHSFKIVESIMIAQINTAKYPDWLGGYSPQPRSTSTATRSEGLVAAYSLARDFGYPQQADEIMDSLDLGIAFQLQTQFRPESLMYVRDPQRCLGGFHHSLSNYQLRIDFTQHNISSLLGLYKLKIQE